MMVSREMVRCLCLLEALQTFLSRKHLIEREGRTWFDNIVPSQLIVHMWLDWLF